MGIVGKLCIISGPSGVGKTTLVDRLCEEYPHRVVQSISCTTRQPRDGEIEGRDYYFIDKKVFQQKVREGAFLEYARVFEHYYGTLRLQVDSLMKRGLVVLLVIDVQGAKQLAAVVSQRIFIMPPSSKILEERVRTRKQDDAEVIQERLRIAEQEMAQSSSYDQVLINDNFEEAYKELVSMIIGR